MSIWVDDILEAIFYNVSKRLAAAEQVPFGLSELGG
jgi:hypothetical protein